MQILQVSFKQELDVRMRRVEQSAHTMNYFLLKTITQHNDRVNDAHPLMGLLGSINWAESRWEMQLAPFWNEGTGVRTTSVGRE